MKTLLMAFALTACSCCFTPAIAEVSGSRERAEEPAKPFMISIGDIHSGWQVLIDESGGGTLSYGSNLQDIGTVKKGTFNLDDTYGLLSDPKNWSEVRTSISVGFMFRDEKKDYGKRLAHATIWENILTQAKKNMTGNSAHVNSLLRKYPPVAGQDTKWKQAVETKPQSQESGSEKLLNASIKGTSLTKEQARNIEQALSAKPDRFTDDLAVIMLADLDKEAGAEALMRLYMVCSEHLAHCRLEAGTSENWRGRDRLRDVFYELNGGDHLAGIFVRSAVLGELQEYVDQEEKGSSAASVKEIRRIQDFLREQAQKLVADYPEPPIKVMLRRMSEGMSFKFDTDVQEREGSTEGRGSE